MRPLKGWATSCALVGCVLGVALAGWISDRFGRRNTLILSAVLFLVSAIGTAIPRTLTEFIVFRIIGGDRRRGRVDDQPDVHRRDQPGPVPRAPGEREPVGDRLRHAGRLLRQLLDRRPGRRGLEPDDRLAMDVRLGGDSRAGLAGVHVHRAGKPAVAEQARARPNRPGTSSCGSAARTTPSARWPRSPTPCPTSRRRSPSCSSRGCVLRSGHRRGPGRSAAGHRHQRLPLLCARDLQRHGRRPTVDAALLQTIVVGAVNLVFTIVAIWTVDRLGRKPLMIVGSVGMGLSLTALGAGGRAGTSRRLGADVHPRLHRLLRAVGRAGHLGDPLGDLPHQDPRPGHGHRHVLPVGGQLRRLPDLSR